MCRGSFIASRHEYQIGATLQGNLHDLKKIKIQQKTLSALKSHV